MHVLLLTGNEHLKRTRREPSALNKIARTHNQQNMTQDNIRKYDTIQYNTIRYDTIQYNTIHTRQYYFCAFLRIPTYPWVFLRLHLYS